VGESSLPIRAKYANALFIPTYRIAFALLFFILIAYLIGNREGGVGMD
jgi:hypothetical protein